MKKNKVRMNNLKSRFFFSFKKIKKVLQTALEHKYEALKVEGFPALFSRPPTIYISDQSHYPLLVESICGSLFIPKKNMRLGNFVCLFLNIEKCLIFFNFLQFSSIFFKLHANHIQPR